MSTRDERRAMLLDAARDVILRYGYRKTTLDDVASAAGVSRATLYNYFPNKQEMFRSLIVTELDGLREAMNAAVDPADAPEVQLLAYLRGRYARLRQLRELYSVVIDLARDLMPMAMAEFDAFGEEQLAFYTSLVRAGVDSGRFRPVDVDLLAGTLFSAIRGLDEGFVFEDQDAMAKGAECLLSTLFVGLLVDPSTSELSTQCEEG